VARATHGSYAYRNFLFSELLVKHPLSLVLLPLLASLSLVPGCEQDHPLTALRDGPRECAELEQTCEAPAAAYGEPFQHCYETGKSKVSNACINYYFDCMDECRFITENPPSEGQGGAAGARATGESGASASGAGGAL